MKRIMVFGLAVLCWYQKAQARSMENGGDKSDLQIQLYDALCSKNKAQVKALLEQGAQPVFVTSDSRRRTGRVNTLDFAIEIYFREQDPTLVRLILEKRMDLLEDILNEPNSLNSGQETPRDRVIRCMKELPGADWLSFGQMTPEEFVGGLVRRPSFNSDADEERHLTGLDQDSGLDSDWRHFFEDDDQYVVSSLPQ